MTFELCWQDFWKPQLHLNGLSTVLDASLRSLQSLVGQLDFPNVLNI